MLFSKLVAVYSYTSSSSTCEVAVDEKSMLYSTHAVPIAKRLSSPFAGFYWMKRNLDERRQRLHSFILA